jgi:hypothetical protein
MPKRRTPSCESKRQSNCRPLSALLDPPLSLNAHRPSAILLELSGLANLNPLGMPSLTPPERSSTPDLHPSFQSPCHPFELYMRPVPAARLNSICTARLGGRLAFQRLVHICSIGVCTLVIYGWPKGPWSALDVSETSI